MATTNSTWAPNELQNKFLNTLKADGPMTLAEFSAKIGKEVKSGSINALITKKLVVTADKEIECLIVRKDNPSQVVGSTKKHVKVYSIVGGEKKATDADGEDTAVTAVGE